MKRTFFAIAALCIVSFTHAQNFSLEAGATAFFGSGKVVSGTESYPVSSAFYGITGYPKYHLTQQENSSVTIGAPITIGMSGTFNSQTGGDFSFGVDAPITIDYNIGFNSSPMNESESGFGAFIGAGFGYTISSQYDEFGGTDDLKSYGPLVHGGIRFPIYQGQKAIAIRVSYKKGLEAEKFNLFGVGLLLGF